jgi:uncharacterized protein (DUF302 family)
MVYTVTTAANIDTIKQEFEAKAKNIGFEIFNIGDFKRILTDKGFPIKKEITVFELCNPSGAQQELDYLPEISVYLPCKISLYQKNGVTTLSTIGIEEIVAKSDIDERFKAYMAILFDNLKQLMHSWDK